jgi:hypothetical protein
MEINDKTDELYLDLKRFIIFVEGKEELKLFGQIIQKRLDLGLAEIYKKHKAAGLPVIYQDTNYPGCLVREDADGKRFIIDLDADNNYQEFVIREIPARQAA